MFQGLTQGHTFVAFDDDNRGYERKWYEGEWTCSQCGAKITKLPFQPTGDRPVYCQDCHRQRRESFRRNFR
ncbi:hypothetical protein HY573_02130 [Candidatus Parcubacteria bacterium]|nr:hypothetical protein [Candidatus Parcubacteria bacterium]MBI4385604.1 hypothetical protein [Candidatus Parcubacteria bacterium]